MNTQNTQYKELHVALMQHIEKNGAGAFKSPVWIVRERGEDDWGRTTWEWAFEFSGEGAHLGLTQDEITTRMREWCKEEEINWDLLNQQEERDAETIKMYKELYVDELMDRITADWKGRD